MVDRDKGKGNGGVIWTRCLCPTKFRSWSPNTQSNGIWRWGLWELNSFRWDHENGVPMMRSEPLLRRYQRASSLIFSLPSKDTTRRQLSINPRKWVLARTWTWWHPNQTSSPELWEINVSYLSQLMVFLLLQPELRVSTNGYRVSFWHDENILELVVCDDCITLWTH